MKKTLLIAAALGWLTLSQTVHANSVVTAPPAVDEQAHAQPDTQSANYQLAQVIHANASLTPADEVPSAKSGMPSVPVGLAGLLVMICVLVKRRNDPS
ncbi:MAG: hypothetical protein Q4D91_03905 [Lautropia sp.]|nr:hypothetical protein [Lautropia sp.]